MYFIINMFRRPSTTDPNNNNNTLTNRLPALNYYENSSIFISCSHQLVTTTSRWCSTMSSGISFVTINLSMRRPSRQRFAGSGTEIIRRDSKARIQGQGFLRRFEYPPIRRTGIQVPVLGTFPAIGRLRSVFLTVLTTQRLVLVGT
ncbi:unnamed protein product [Nesidiocoris tenuis]|uniref:Uncharacterized protein n=1 Tax=Nesidiocoris tenuis TaxID=355587 RepID=A0A6H5GXT1_9HEMI|nr:unnamed protein product [Nesidiocoris tenuis]